MLGLQSGATLENGIRVFRSAVGLSQRKNPEKFQSAGENSTMTSCRVLSYPAGG